MPVQIFQFCWYYIPFEFVGFRSKRNE